MLVQLPFFGPGLKYNCLGLCQDESRHMTLMYKQAQLFYQKCCTVGAILCVCSDYDDDDDHHHHEVDIGEDSINNYLITWSYIYKSHSTFCSCNFNIGNIHFHYIWSQTTDNSL